MKISQTAAALLAVVLSASPALAARGEAEIRLGLSELEHKAYGAAISHFAKAAKLKRDSTSYFLLGYAHYQRGFISGSPESADKNDATETIKAYTMALDLDPELRAVNQPYRLYHSLALSYEALGATEKAIEAYKKAFEAAPRNPMLPLYAARLRYQMGEIQKSAANLALSLKLARAAGREAAIRKLIEKNPFFSAMLRSPAHQELVTGAGASIPEGGILAQARGSGDVYELRDSVREAPESRSLSRHDPVLEQAATADQEFKFLRCREAIDAYRQALTLNQESGALSPSQTGAIHEKIGTCYHRLGLSSEAIRSLQRSVRDLPANVSAHYRLALAYSLSGQYAESLRALGETFRSAPSQGELRKYLLLAKTDAELEPVRDLPGFARMLGDYQERLQARR